MREVFAAFGASDREKLTSLAMPDMTRTFPSTSPSSGTFVGADWLLGGIRPIAMTLGRGINGFGLLEVHAKDHSAVTIQRGFSTDPDHPFDQHYIGIALSPSFGNDGGRDRLVLHGDGCQRRGGGSR